MKQFTVGNKGEQKKSPTTSTAKFEIPKIESTLEKIEEEQQQEEEDEVSTLAAVLFMGLLGKMNSLKKKARDAAENERLANELNESLSEEQEEEEQSRGCGCGW